MLRPCIAGLTTTSSTYEPCTPTCSLERPWVSIYMSWHPCTHSSTSDNTLYCEEPWHGAPLMSTGYCHVRGHVIVIMSVCKSQSSLHLLSFCDQRRSINLLFESVTAPYTMQLYYCYTCTPLHAFIACNAVYQRGSCPSVHSVVRRLWQNRTKFCLDFHTTWKSIYPSFVTRRMVSSW